MSSSVYGTKKIIGNLFNLENLNGKNISLFTWIGSGAWNELYFKNLYKVLQF